MNMNGYEIKDGVLDLGKTSISTIENKAFLSSKTVREVILPKTVSHIGDWAFAKCINLRKVRLACDFRPGLFGKDVFSGCGMLSSIEFADGDPVTAGLLALCANRLPYDHLLRSDDVGQRSWYEKWDICLVAKLKSDDAEAKMSAALCGEEDISYDGIGSVDGEMPGETDDFLQREEFSKSILCYIRLSNDRFLSDMTRTVITDHIKDNRFGIGRGSSFYSIFEETGKVQEYLRLYLDTVKPDKQTLKEMIAQVPVKDVYAKSFLIRESNGNDDVLAGMML